MTNGVGKVRDIQNQSSEQAYIAKISSVAWQHINLYGRYEFNQLIEPINMEEMIDALAQYLILSIGEDGGCVSFQTTDRFYPVGREIITKLT